MQNNPHHSHSRQRKPIIRTRRPAKPEPVPEPLTPAEIEYLMPLARRAALDAYAERLAAEDDEDQDRGDCS